MPIPEWSKYWRVDACIECLELTPNAVAELMERMPDAYGVKMIKGGCYAHRGAAIPTCGDCMTVEMEDAWPEPDSSRDEPFKLSKIWNKLSGPTKENLEQAYRKSADYA